VAGTYLNWLNLLQVSRAQLRGVELPVGPAAVRDWMRSRSEVELRAADAACEEFALNRVWPPIRTDSVVALVLLRVMAALDLCRAMGHQPVPAGVTERELLRSLLLDYGRERLKRLEVPGDSAGWLGATVSGESGSATPPRFAGPGFNLTVAG
jgi:hypothetical protein